MLDADALDASDLLARAGLFYSPSAVAAEAREMGMTPRRYAASLNAALAAARAAADES